MRRQERESKFREWLKSLDEELRRDLPDDLAGLSDDELDECVACQRFLESFRRTVDECRSAPLPAIDQEHLKRAADAAREELRQKGLL